MTRLLTEQVYTQAMNEMHTALPFFSAARQTAPSTYCFTAPKSLREEPSLSRMVLPKTLKNIRNLFITCCKAVITSAFRSTAVTDTAIA